MHDYSAQVEIDNEQMSMRTLHCLEKCRTMVLQDAQMDYRSSIFSMITNTDIDDLKQQRTPQIDLLVWELIKLVQIEDFINTFTTMGSTGGPHYILTRKFIEKRFLLLFFLGRR